MTALGVAYTAQTGGGVYNLVVDTFTGAEVARAYEAAVQFTRGVSGQALIAGQSSRQKYIWAVSALVSEADAKTLDDMFKSWDADRATGAPVAVGITDQTLFDPLTTSAIFSTPPTYRRSGPYHFTVSFGLVEV
jgi:hypothetical protein